MSGIDFKDPAVMKNWIKSLIREKRGEFRTATVLLFKAEDGIEYRVPVEMEDEVHEMLSEADKAKEVEMPEPSVELEVEQSDEVTE